MELVRKVADRMSWPEERRSVPVARLPMNACAFAVSHQNMANDMARHTWSCSLSFAAKALTLTSTRGRGNCAKAPASAPS